MIAAMFLPLLLSAEILLVEPAAEKVVPLVPANQKELIAMPDHAARKQLLAEQLKKGKRYGFFDKKHLWRRALPISFTWKCSAGRDRNIPQDNADKIKFVIVPQKFCKKH